MTIDPALAKEAPYLVLFIMLVSAGGAGFWAVLRWLLRWFDGQNTKWMHFLESQDAKRDEQNGKRDEILREIAQELASLKTQIASQHSLVQQMAERTRPRPGGL